MGAATAGCRFLSRGRGGRGRRGSCAGSGSRSGVLRSISSSSVWRGRLSARFLPIIGRTAATYRQLVHAWRVRLMTPAGAGCADSWGSIPTDAISRTTQSTRSAGTVCLRRHSAGERGWGWQAGGARGCAWQTSCEEPPSRAGQRRAGCPANRRTRGRRGGRAALKSAPLIGPERGQTPLG